MKSSLVETSVIIKYLRGEQKTINCLNSFEAELSSSYVCLAELYEGISRVKNPTRVEKAVLNFFAGMSHIYGLNQEIAQKFGQIRAKLKRKGQIIDDLDILIAATCLANNLVLITENQKHFKRIEELEIWPK
jgi:predicted nucleic acid-binding protein